MEVLIGLLVLGLALFIPVVIIVSLVRAARRDGEIRRLKEAVAALETRVSALARRIGDEPAASASAGAADASAGGSEPEPATSAIAPEPVLAAEISVPVADSAPAFASEATAPAPDAATPVPPPSMPQPRAARSSSDIATSWGPGILVAVGALAVVVALGLFVKYAWDNNWIGPAGRVLIGSVASLAMLAAGMRLMRGVYRPLGQGLAGAGLAGLYATAYGAHAFYGLVSREASAALLIVITLNAILLAVRLDARLLASLAWIGAYLTPVLLSTGQDKGLSLFIYLALLDAGAVVVDRRKPWPETLPLAFFGTLGLYGAWFLRFFRPERFEVAAFGLVLFTALFALGAAHKERRWGSAAVISLAALGLSCLAAGADRPAALLVLSLALAGAALWTGSSRGGKLGAAAAFLASGLPFAAWAIAHYRPGAFGIAAAWIVLAALLFVLPGRSGREVAAPVQAVALGAGGLASVLLAWQTDRPAALLGLLVAQAGLAVLARKRWAASELLGLAAAALSVLVWFDTFYRLGREGDAYLLAIPLAGLYLLVLLGRGLVLGQQIGAIGVISHLTDAAFLWTVLYRVLYEANPGALGFASVALAALYLVVGLAASRERPQDDGQKRVTLGLAASFVTLAIPVQLGLNGITLAWAAEGVVLLGLGLRMASPLARAGGYGVIGLAVGRLFVRHLPLHPHAFVPVMNPAFGTWLAVVVALALALWLSRGARGRGESPDRLVGGVATALTLALLFGLLTGEAHDAFAQRAATAARLGDTAAVQQARLAGGLAVSVLWSVFATALLAAALGLRSRPLFYTAYGLFGVAAAKVVLVDLAQLETIYRILSFLALGVLLMAGAYLNIRFRARLMPREALP